ncbi:unnamed protein product, partial [marine sediment metagenome]
LYYYGDILFLSNRYLDLDDQLQKHKHNLGKMTGKKYLITGGWGRLGSHMKDSIPSVASRKNQMNILSTNQVEYLVKTAKFDAILHLAAISNQKLAEKEKLLSYQVNVLGTRNVAEIAQKYSLKLYYISTDYVFPGTKGNYKETDDASPANWYGFTKYAGELEVKNAIEDYCIIRTSFRPTKWEFPTAYTNVYTSADYVDIIAKEIILCLDYNLNDIIHIGTSIKSFYELAKIRNPNIIPEKCHDQTFPKRRDLNIDKWLFEKKKRGTYE